VKINTRKLIRRLRKAKTRFGTSRKQLLAAHRDGILHHLGRANYRAAIIGEPL
jgi:hypothetical protein